MIWSSVGQESFQEPVALHSEAFGDPKLKALLGDLATLDLTVEATADGIYSHHFTEAVVWEAEALAMGTDCRKEIGGEDATDV